MIDWDTFMDTEMMDVKAPSADQLLTLTPEQAARCQTLFVAPYAPTIDAPCPDAHPVHGVAPRYNYELYSILKDLNVPVTPCSDLHHFTSLLPEHDFVFTIFNQARFRNSEMYVSTICEFHQVPYLGAPPNIRALAEDKLWSKLVAQNIGLPVMPGLVYASEDSLIHPPPFPGPYFIKPRFSAASIGIEVESIQDCWDGIKRQCLTLFEQGRECLVEQCIDGTDITQPVIGGASPLFLPASEEVSDLPYGIATYEQKRMIVQGRERHILEDMDIQSQLAEMAQRFIGIVKPFDYLRMDYRLERHTRKLYFMEFNIGCNLGSHAAIALGARKAGIEHRALIAHLVAYSLKRQTGQRLI